METHQHINQDSGNVEYYTPPEIIEAARRTMGGIDLDPASSSAANRRVVAENIYTVHDDGLSKPWHGRVWLNHPFGRGHNQAWMAKMIREWESGRMEECCCITFAATSEKWFEPLLWRPQCFLVGRTNFFLPDGTKKTGVTKGSVVTYFGKKPRIFDDAFSHLGVCKIPITHATGSIKLWTD